MCVCCVLCVVLFFFQAEDGIRDLVRSRGLGDVYKRQVDYDPDDDLQFQISPIAAAFIGLAGGFFLYQIVGAIPVSYTHLTLPTSDLV